MVIRSQKELLERLEQGYNLVRKAGRWYVQKRLPKGKFHTEIVDKSLDSFCEQIREGKEKEKIADKTEEELQKKIQKTTVQRFVKTIDDRTKWVMEWGLWVENNLLPHARGETFEDKAKFVIDMLEELKNSYPEYLRLQDKIRVLEAENRALKDLLNSLQKKMSIYTIIGEALKTAVSNGAEPEIIDTLLNKLLELQIRGVERWVSM